MQPVEKQRIRALFERVMVRKWITLALTGKVLSTTNELRLCLGLPTVNASLSETALRTNGD
jgi:hypothetical protein